MHPIKCNLNNALQVNLHIPLSLSHCVWEIPIKSHILSHMAQSWTVQISSLSNRLFIEYFLIFSLFPRPPPLRPPSPRPNVKRNRIHSAAITTNYMFSPTDAVSAAPSPLPSPPSPPPPPLSYRLSVTRVGVAIVVPPVTWTHKISPP